MHILCITFANISQQMPLGYYSLMRWRCQTCNLVTMDLPEPPWTWELYRLGKSYKDCRDCQAKSCKRILTLRTFSICFFHADSQLPIACAVYYIFTSKRPCRTALQKAKIPANIQTQIVSFLVLSQKQASLRKFYFRILVGNQNNTSNSPFLQFRHQWRTTPPIPRRPDLLDRMIRFLVR